MCSLMTQYKNEILDLALNTDGFEHLEELLIAVNTNSKLMQLNTEMVLKGYQLILLVIQHNNALQRNTL
ncbi:hypothetical protein [Bacillus cereus]|uniref:Uncharacterized protein n=1 Tax=Bacillus cereus TIAC219 TaxID=718222 RepID=A0ABC9SUV9_BACCE|nr:hypothetical protein [Bacillus cereus]EJP85994.1 hypothetical protein IC1_04412 [Bacillus cereus VD022]EOQ59742.1 hypothetical protein IAY_03939 [Bacillus cereus TIAC219]